jgi:hypothetical protein
MLAFNAGKHSRSVAHTGRLGERPLQRVEARGSEVARKRQRLHLGRESERLEEVDKRQRLVLAKVADLQRVQRERVRAARAPTLSPW